MNHSRSLATTDDVDLCSLAGYLSYFALASSRSWAHVTAGCARHCAAMARAVLARHITLQSTGHHPCRACTRVKIFSLKKKKNLVYFVFRQFINRVEFPLLLLLLRGTRTCSAHASWEGTSLLLFFRWLSRPLFPSLHPSTHAHLMHVFVRSCSLCIRRPRVYSTAATTTAITAATTTATAARSEPPYTTRVMSISRFQVCKKLRSASRFQSPVASQNQSELHGILPQPRLRSRLRVS